MSDHCGVCGRPLSLRNGSHWFGYALCNVCMDEAARIARNASPVLARASVVSAIQQLQSVASVDASEARLLCGNCSRSLELRFNRASETVICHFCGAKSALPLSVRKDLWRRQLSGVALQTSLASLDANSASAIADETARGVRFECPVCHGDVIVWHAKRGEQTECPACEVPLTVPATAGLVTHDSARSGTSAASVSALQPTAHVTRGGSERRMAPVKRANPLATVGFVLGLVSSFFWSFAIVPVLAVVFSSVGLARASRLGAGRALAWIGLVLGSIYFVFAVVMLSVGRW